MVIGIDREGFSSVKTGIKKTFFLRVKKVLVFFLLGKGSMSKTKVPGLSELDRAYSCGTAPDLHRTSFEFLNFLMI